MPDDSELYAYSLGLQAYLFGFPYVYLSSVRWNWVAVEKPDGSEEPYAPLNHFHHARKFPDARSHDGRVPSQDTLSSVAWVDLTSEPVILSHPDMGDRYFCFQLTSLDSDNFAYVGARATGSRPASFALVGPGWRGALPEGVHSLPRSRTASALVLGSTFADGAPGFSAVHALQDEYRLTPLSQWGQPDPHVGISRDVWSPFDSRSDGLSEWRTMNRALTEEPPEPSLASLLKLFATIGVGPGQDLSRQPEAIKHGLRRAAADGLKLLAQAISSSRFGARVNGWATPPHHIGRAGRDSDFLLRATQCLDNLAAHDAEEVACFTAIADSEGRTLDGATPYVLHFEAGQLPACKAMWSLTVYDTAGRIIDHAIQASQPRHRRKRLKMDADGGVTIQLQRTRPSGEGATNWLLTPRHGAMTLLLRIYIPDSVAAQHWAPPPLKPACVAVAA